MNNEKKPTVAVIFGGRGKERSVSLKGKDYLISLIDRDKYDLKPICIEEDGRWNLDGEEILLCEGGFYQPERRENIRINCAFPLLHGDFGEDGVVQGALECHNIPYVGCDTSAGAVCRDKSFVKIIAKSLEIPTLPFVSLFRGEGLDYAVRRAEEKLNYPMFIKPARLGSSIGASAARSQRELVSALRLAFSLSERAVAEPYLSDKRELECGYLQVKGKEIFTNPGEIKIKGVYGYDEKYLSGDTELSIRANIGYEICEDVREYSRRLVRALGVRDLSRVDFFLSGDDLYLNEINTMPGFTEGSLYPKLIEAAGITPNRMVDMLIEGAMTRG